MTSRVHHLNCATSAHPPGGVRSLMVPRPSRTACSSSRIVASRSSTPGSAPRTSPTRDGWAACSWPPPAPCSIRPRPRWRGSARSGSPPRSARRRGHPPRPRPRRRDRGLPGASVHVLGEELDAARDRTSAKEKGRYVPAQWAHDPTGWSTPPPAGSRGSASSRSRWSATTSCSWLRGHTRGHAAVAVRRPGGGWFLHCGDAYFFHAEKQRPPPARWACAGSSGWWRWTGRPGARTRSGCARCTPTTATR